MSDSNKEHSMLSDRDRNQSRPTKSSLILRSIPDFNPQDWRPILHFNNLKDPTLLHTKLTENVQLVGKSITRIPEISSRGGPKFELQSSYEVKGVMPRSYFSIIYSKEIKETFILALPNYGIASVFDQVKALRKTIMIHLWEQTEKCIWECHFKVAKEGTVLFGYLIKASEMRQTVEDKVTSLLSNRQLPLVLDLDDTLVRLVGREKNRFVPHEQAEKVSSRRFDLKDNRQVVLCENVGGFLDWAKSRFEISICSLGEQSYVEQVADILDPDGTRIRGVRYSARQEYDYYYQRTQSNKRPPKNLKTMFPYCAITDEEFLGNSITLPLIVDDMTQAWPESQHYNILVVKEQKDKPIWTVALPVVQHVLNMVHTAFFKKLEKYKAEVKDNRPLIPVRPPSVVKVYFELMCGGLTGFIGRGDPMGSFVLDPKAIPEEFVPPPPPAPLKSPRGPYPDDGPPDKSKPPPPMAMRGPIPRPPVMGPGPPPGMGPPPPYWERPEMGFEPFAPGPHFMYPPEMGMMGPMDGPPPPFGPPGAGPWPPGPGMHGGMMPPRGAPWPQPRPDPKARGVPPPGPPRDGGPAPDGSFRSIESKRLSKQRGDAAPINGSGESTKRRAVTSPEKTDHKRSKHTADTNMIDLTEEDGFVAGGPGARLKGDRNKKRR